MNTNYEEIPLHKIKILKVKSFTNIYILYTINSNIFLIY